MNKLINTAAQHAVDIPNALRPENKPVTNSINKTSKDAANGDIHKPVMPVVLGYEAVVESIDHAKQYYQLDIATRAYAAEGLLVRPEVGDTVLSIKLGGHFYISQVVKRQQPHETLVIESPRPIQWVAPVLRFKAWKDIELASAKKLTLSAQDVIVGASNTLIQQAKTLLQQVTSYSLHTKGLMRLQGRQQLIVAEEDIRMDAKRINMG